MCYTAGVVEDDAKMTLNKTLRRRVDECFDPGDARLLKTNARRDNVVLKRLLKEKTNAGR